MTRRPRIVVIDEEVTSDQVRQSLDHGVDIVRAASPEEALDILKRGEGDAVLPDAFLTQESIPENLTISSHELLQRIATGIAVVDSDFKIHWHNRSFAEMCGQPDLVGRGIYDAIGCEEIRGPDFCPFTECLGSSHQSHSQVRLHNGRHLEISVQKLSDNEASPVVLLCLVRDITSEVKEREKMTAIHRAGLELGHLTSAELALMTTDERIDLLKANILQHSQNILKFRFLEIRLLDPQTKQLKVLLSEGMTQSPHRDLFALPDGNGVTGFVAATGTSYLCEDVQNDPLYLPGAPGARSSLTVPMLYRDRVVGTFNVESAEAGKFGEADREFLEIFAREIAVALNTLELLEAEKQMGGSATVSAIVNEVSLPVDEIVSDSIRVLDFLLQHDTNRETAHSAVRRVLLNARAIKNAIQKVGMTVEREAPAGGADLPTRLTGKRVLVVDADAVIRRAAHVMLSQLGCEVDTARDGREAIQLARTIEYDVVVSDIRLSDMNGYELFSAMRETIPRTPVVLMTGFGYDATHSIVRARQEGLRSVLYKPFRLDRIREAVADALHLSSAQDRPRSSMDMGTKQKLL